MIKKKYDALIIGTGLSGGWAIKELSESGLNVAAIDAGNILDNSFFINKLIKDEKYSFYANFLKFKSFLSKKQTSNTALLFRINKKIFETQKSNPYLSYNTFNWLRARKVGGRGHVWGRVCPRYTKNELQYLNTNGKVVKWPISINELNEYYNEVESLLKLDNINERGFNSEEKIMAQNTIEKWPNRVLEKIPVMQYEPSPLSPMLLKALKTKNVDIFENCIVRKLNTNVKGVAESVEIINKNSNDVFNIYADIIILAASPFETVRLLLNSKSNYHKTSLGNTSNLLGKYIYEHINSEYFGFLPKKLWSSEKNKINPFKPNAEGNGFYIRPFRHKENNNINFKEKFGIQGSISKNQKSIYLIAFGQTTPNIDNLIHLDSVKKDQWNVPLIKIKYNWSSKDINMWKDQNKISDELILNYEIKNNIKIDRRDKVNNPTPGSAHEAGGAKMGDNQNDSVVDQNGRLWDSPNVVICDASIFPSCGYQNPANTIMALSIKNSRNIVKQFKLKKLLKI